MTIRSLSRVRLGLSLAAGVLAGIGILIPATPVAAKVAAATFSGAAPGSVTSAWSAKVSFSPGLTKSGGGTNPSELTRGKTSSCKTSDSVVKITKGKVTGSFASSPVACPFTLTHVAASLTISWTGKVNGIVGATTYAGKASFTPTTVTATPFAGTATGSFAGDAKMAVEEPAVFPIIRCKRSTGSITKVRLNGTITVGTTSTSTSSSPGALWFTNRGGNSIGRITTSGTVTNYADSTIDEPTGITQGPDGALWFTNQTGGTYGGGSIGRITGSGQVSNYEDSAAGVNMNAPTGITLGPDGALWFTNASGDVGLGRITTSGGLSHVGDAGGFGVTVGPDGALWATWGSFLSRPPQILRTTTAGQVTGFTNSGISNPRWITMGPDGALWFTDDGGPSGWIGRITTSGAVTTFTDPTISEPNAITVGPDGALWFTNYTGGPSNTGSIGRITTSGAVTNFTDATIDAPTGITLGPDGALWFTNAGGGPSNTGSIGRITTSGAVTNFTDATIDGPTGITVGP